MAGNLELVKKLREESGAGFLACQKALQEANNDYDKAYDILRKQGILKASSKTDRVASEGLVGVKMNESGIAIVKLNCETDFVAKNEKFQALLEDILFEALDNQTITIDELLSCSHNEKSIKDLITENIAIIGENIVIGEVVYKDIAEGQTASYYVHKKIDGKENMGRIVSANLSNDVINDDAKLLTKLINMHIAAMSPIALDEKSISEDILIREKNIYKEQVDKLNKPADIAEKMIEGKMRKFYEENVLLKQIFILDNKNSVENVIKEFNKKNSCNLSIISFARVAI